MSKCERVHQQRFAIDCREAKQENASADRSEHDEALELPIPTGSISFNLPMRNTSRPAGETARLVCEITGDPKPKYVWLKDGRVVTKDERIVSQDTLWGHRLRIDSLQAKDEGWYTCVASNAFGSANTSAYLRILPRKCSFNPNNSVVYCDWLLF